MAETVKSLGQLLPGQNALGDLYVVPVGASAVVSTVMVCNQANSPTTFRLALSVGGAGDDPKQYLYYDEVLPSRKTFAITLGLTMGAADRLKVQSANGKVSFNASGSEIA